MSKIPALSAALIVTATATILGAGSAQALSKNYGHCVYYGTIQRGCTNGTWWQDAGTRLVYDRAYWRYVSGPNSTYHVTYYETDFTSGSDSFRSPDTKSTTSLTARYQWAPPAAGVLHPSWTVSADVCEDEYLSPDNCRDAGESLSGTE